MTERSLQKWVWYWRFGEVVGEEKVVGAVENDGDEEAWFSKEPNNGGVSIQIQNI